MKRFLILAAMLCGLTTLGASTSEASWRYRGGYYGGYGGYRTPYYGGYGYGYGGYRTPYRSSYRGGWNRGYSRGWGGSGVYGGFGRRGGGVYIGW